MQRLISTKFLRPYLIIAMPISTFTLYIFHKKTQEQKFALLEKLPLRIFSRVFGRLSDQTLPNLIKYPLLYVFCFIYGVDLNEINRPFRSFNSFSDFFSRTIEISKHRPMSNSEIVSPVDGNILSFGKITSGSLLNAKGIEFSLERLLGSSALKDSQNLHFALIYLAPGDYHRFHSPANWKIQKLRHFVGELLPVNSIFARIFPDLFVENERIVLEGRWEHGYFGMVPIGAFNVGSIRLSPMIDPNLVTNKAKGARKSFEETDFEDLDGEPIVSHKGEEMGYFKLGSSVVFIFELPVGKQFSFSLDKGKKIRVGESIGLIN